MPGPYFNAHSWVAGLVECDLIMCARRLVDMWKARPNLVPVPRGLHFECPPCIAVKMIEYTGVGRLAENGSFIVDGDELVAFIDIIQPHLVAQSTYTFLDLLKRTARAVGPRAGAGGGTAYGEAYIREGIEMVARAMDAGEFDRAMHAPPEKEG